MLLGKWTCPTCEKAVNFSVPTVLQQKRSLTFPNSQSNSIPLPPYQKYRTSISDDEDELPAPKKDKGKQRERSYTGESSNSSRPRIRIPAALAPSGLKLTLKMGNQLQSRSDESRKRPKRNYDLEEDSFDWRGQSEEIIEEEFEEIPYGGVLKGGDANMDDRAPVGEDRKKFEKAVAQAQVSFHSLLMIDTS